MSLRIQLDSFEQNYARAVLHGFSHALGLKHVHQVTPSVLPWDLEALYSYYKKIPKLVTGLGKAQCAESTSGGHWATFKLGWKLCYALFITKEFDLQRGGYPGARCIDGGGHCPCQ